MIVMGGRADDLESGHETGAVIDNKRIAGRGQGIAGSSCASLRPRTLQRRPGVRDILHEHFI